MKLMKSMKKCLCYDLADPFILKCAINTTGEQRVRIHDRAMQINGRFASVLFIPGYDIYDSLHSKEDKSWL